MERPLKGLRHECQLLEAEIAVCESGPRHEYDLLPNRKRSDITTLYTAHLKDVLAVKRKFIATLEAHYAKGA